MNRLVFDIETVPDMPSAKRLAHVSHLSDAEAAMALRRHADFEMPSFYPLFLHRVVAISVLLEQPERVQVWSLGEPQDSEAALITRFFEGLDKLQPVLVSWNGTGFDLPVLHYRALLHQVAAPTYWDKGERHPSFRWDHYTNRYHERHLDLMERLSSFQPRAYAKLDHVSQLLGLPGKAILKGNEVEQAYHAGRVGDIRSYCEVDVLNTYLIYLRFEHMRGKRTRAQVHDQHAALRDYLAAQQASHLQAFVAQWDETDATDD